MFRFLTAGESHGKALSAIIEGTPAGIEVPLEFIRSELARRRLGYGRGARMKFEEDVLQVLGGVRHGRSMGGPISLVIENSEWPKWEKVMSPEVVDPAELAELSRAHPLTRPRPGHADLVGMQKYGFEDARPVLERASARETAARVAVGAIAKLLLKQIAGIEIVSHVTRIGGIENTESLPINLDAEQIDNDPVRCSDPAVSALMQQEIADAHKAGDTLGGVVEVLAFNVPIGLGSYVHWDRKLDARLAFALMSIHAVKAVEIGDGFKLSAMRGSQAQDEIYNDGQSLRRKTSHAGGTEGGVSNGEVLRVSAGMKPISTIPRALDTVDIATGESAKAINQRSDVCAVPALGVIAEAMVAIVPAEALLEKFGGDSLEETRRNLTNFVENLSF
jgi:chorismate synthase